MIKTIFSVLFVSIFLYIAYSFNTADKPLSAKTLHTYYQENAISELGAENVVASVVVSYRGLDTLGEVTVLFLSALLIAFMIGLTRKEKTLQSSNKTKTAKQAKKIKSSEILETATSFLTPFIFILGLYVIINGHLTPGGGFQGGAILATGLILLIVTNINYKVREKLLKYIESFSGVFYVLIALLGLLMTIGFLNPRVLPIGNIGTIISAGLIPIVYVLIGMKVGAELSLIFANFGNKNK